MTMIDPADATTIRFAKSDVPVLPDVEPYDKEAEQRRRCEQADRMEGLFGFRPFGGDW